MSRPSPTPAGAGRIDRLLDVFGTGTGRINANPAVSDTNNATFTKTTSIWADTAHGYYAGELIQFSVVGTGAEPFLVDTDYYVIEGANADTFKLASSLANAKAGTAIAGTVANSTSTWTVEVQNQTFRAGPPAGQEWEVMRIIVHIRDTDSSFNAERYGAIDVDTAGTGLLVNTGYSSADGGAVIHYLLGEDEDGSSQHTVKSNFDWEAICFDASRNAFGSGDDAIAVRWSFFKGNPGNRGIILNGDDGHEIQVVIQDDLSGLVDHHFRIEGAIIG